MLSDFRKDHGEALDELLSVNVAMRIDAGVVKLRQVGLMIADRQFGAFALSIGAIRAPRAGEGGEAAG